MFRGYTDKDFPLGAYAGLVAAYGTLYGGIALSLKRSGVKLAEPQLDDVLLLGVATHKLSRLIAKDWVTIPFRAPFTRYERPAPGAEVVESSRGKGLQKAIGDLVSCPFCMGPWVAGALVATFARAPRFARLVATVFASVAMSDFLHRAYGVVGEKKKELSERSKAAREPKMSLPARGVATELVHPESW